MDKSLHVKEALGIPERAYILLSGSPSLGSRVSQARYPGNEAVWYRTPASAFNEDDYPSPLFLHDKQHAHAKYLLKSQITTLGPNDSLQCPSPSHLETAGSVSMETACFLKTIRILDEEESS